MFGKRPRKRPPMKRTTSMTEFSSDDLKLVIQQPPPSDQNHSHQAAVNLDHQTVSARSLHRRNSADFVLESNGTFLRTCSLCNRRLAPTRDIYMYSLECRQQRMTQDEWKGNSIKKESNSSPSHSAIVSSTQGASRLYNLYELKLDGIEAASLLSGALRLYNLYELKLDGI